MQFEQKRRIFGGGARKNSQEISGEKRQQWGKAPPLRKAKMSVKLEMTGEHRWEMEKEMEMETETEHETETATASKGRRRETKPWRGVAVLPLAVLPTCLSCDCSTNSITVSIRPSDPSLAL